MRYDRYDYPPYVPVAQRKAKARRKQEQLKKKHPDIRPVVVEGRTLAHTWWGKAWNRNLERYADYANRVGRGRSYVRHGCVLDLQISRGRVDALVQGNRHSPYNVAVEIKAIDRSSWKRITSACEGQLASLPELLEGRFPEALMDLFMAEGTGLFPAPKEIHFECSCPDWAAMCKHVAATLYGIGTRLDKDPGLFFVLRQVKVEDLVAQAVRGKSAQLIRQAKTKSSRVIEDGDLGDVFGIDLAATMEAAGPRQTKSKGVAKIRRKAAAKTAKRKTPKKNVKATANKAKRKKKVKKTK